MVLLASAPFALPRMMQNVPFGDPRPHVAPLIRCLVLGMAAEDLPRSGTTRGCLPGGSMVPGTQSPRRVAEPRVPAAERLGEMQRESRTPGKPERAGRSRMHFTLARICSHAQ